MIYFVHGTDTRKARKKLHELLQLSQKKRPGAELFKITAENWTEGQFDELLVSHGLLEGKIDAPTLKKMEKVSRQVQKFENKEAPRRELNIFSVTDGLVKKDKRHLWISYVDLIGKGAGAEEIHGILFWQVKNMILASKADSAKETGLSPFAYKNALVGAKKYKTGELTEMSSQLVGMVHRVRRG